MNSMGRALANKSLGIGWIYGMSFFGLTLVIISLMGNAVGSFVESGEIGRFTLSNYAEVIGDRDFVPVLGRTMVLGVGSVAVVILFSFPFAWLLARTDFRWKGALFTLLTAKLAIPGFITAMAYVWLFNPTAGIINKMLGATGVGGAAAFDVYQMTWICFLQGVVLTPGATFLMLPAFRNMDGSLEEAAWVSGVSKFRTIRRVVLPLLMPGVFAVALFFFVVSIEIFDIVAIIGMPAKLDVLTIWIYDAMNPNLGLPNIGFAGATGMLLFAMCAVAIAIYIRFLRQAERFAVIGGKSRRFVPQPLGKWQWVAAAFVGFWVLAGVVIPVLALIWVALVPYMQGFSVSAVGQMNTEGFSEALTYIGDPLVNTLLVMVGAVILSASLSICISWLVTRSQSKAVRLSDGLVFLAPAVPTIVMGVAFQYAGIAAYHWLPLYGTIWLVALAMGTRFLAYCTRTMNAASLQIQYTLDEAALASGVTKLAAFRRIFLPLMFPAIFYSAMLVGMLAARDLTLPLIMLTGETYTISTLIFDLQESGANNEAAALSIYMILLLVILAVIAHRVSGMSEHGAADQETRRNGLFAFMKFWRKAKRDRPAMAPAE